MLLYSSFLVPSFHAHNLRVKVVFLILFKSTQLYAYLSMSMCFLADIHSHVALNTRSCIKQVHIRNCSSHTPMNDESHAQGHVSSDAYHPFWKTIHKYVSHTTQPCMSPLRKRYRKYGDSLFF